MHPQPLRLALSYAFFYSLFLASGMWSLAHVFNAEYGGIGMSLYTLPWMLVLGPLTVWFAYRYFDAKTQLFVRPQLLGLMLMLVPLASIVQSQVLLAGQEGFELYANRYIAAGFVTMMMAGFGEEVLFRGILIPALNKHMPLWGAVLLSSVLFGVAHFGNLAADRPFDEVSGQVFGASLSGVFYASVFVLSRSIWPGLVLHWLWDFNLQTWAYAPDTVQTLFDEHFMFLIVVQPYQWLVAASVVLWLVFKHAKRPSTSEQRA